jgi:2-furoate---CoA ligase
VTLARAITLAAERYPDAEAVVAESTRYTYARWSERINRLARRLGELGLRRGDHVVLLLKNREEHAAMYWACQSLGAIATPLNWRSSTPEIEYCATDAEAVAVVFEGASGHAALAARPALSKVRAWIGVGEGRGDGVIPFESMGQGREDPGPPRVAVDESDVSIMLYTSGTTGRPKGVPRTHRNERSAALAHIIQSGNALGDRTLAVMPLYHTMGVRSMIAMALLNGCLVCLPDWSPTAAATAIAAERVNALYLVPTLYHDLLALPDLDRHDLGSVKKLGYAGAPMATTLCQRLAEHFRPDVFVNHLGSTEVYTHTICNRVMQKPACAGRPGVFGRARVVRADPERQGSPDALVARGETGELIVSLDSPEAFAGYWRRPDADARALRGGWYFTGDLVHEDPEGDIYTVGRVDDMIISGGENIYPIEVEDVLLTHADVAEACVLGLPDERLGQVVTAFVVRRTSRLTADDLDAFCRTAPGFAAFKRPRRYEFVEGLPKSPTGKLLRRVLLEERR